MYTREFEVSSGNYTYIEICPTDWTYYSGATPKIKVTMNNYDNDGLNAWVSVDSSVHSASSYDSSVFTSTGTGTHRLYLRCNILPND